MKIIQKLRVYEMDQSSCTAAIWTNVVPTAPQRLLTIVEEKLKKRGVITLLAFLFFSLFLTKVHRNYRIEPKCLEKIEFEFEFEFRKRNYTESVQKKIHIGI
jgi:hypothetical protein